MDYIFCAVLWHTVPDEKRGLVPEPLTVAWIKGGEIFIFMESSKLVAFLRSQNEYHAKLQSYRPILELLEDASWFDHDLFEELFVPMFDVMAFHADFLNELNNTTLVGTTLLDFFDDFELVYGNYIQRYPRALELSKSLQSNHTLQRALSAFAKSGKNCLDPIINTPILYFSRYHDQFSAMVLELTSRHPDHEAVSLCVSKLHELKHDLQSYLDAGPESDLKEVYDLIASIPQLRSLSNNLGNVALKNQFQISTLNSKHFRSSPRVCILFDTALLITKPSYTDDAMTLKLTKIVKFPVTIQVLAKRGTFVLSRIRIFFFNAI